MPNNQATYRIALIDDEPQILSALRRELRAEPLEITTFDDPTVALETLSNGDFAIVLSDNLMPNLTGLELLAQVKETRPMTRRVLLTGRTDLNQAVEAFNSGTIHGFLHKPWSKDQLLETIRKELGIYQSAVDAVGANAKVAEQNKVRTAKLISTMRELKQAQTQLVLLEDSAHLDVLRVASELRTLSILVVDEHEAVRDLLVKSINGVGIAKCQGSPHANAALAHLATAPRVDIVLSEWALPGVDGLDFLRRLRESGSASANACFLLMAGHEQKPLVDHALRSGVDGYLVKPFRLRSLLKQIESRGSKGGMTQLDDLTPLRKASILVANSHPASREQIEGFLQQTGIPAIFRATFGPAAMAIMRERRPDIIIYDVNVKDPTWEDLHKSLKKEPASPALLITGVLSEESVLKTMQQAGIKHYLPGPFTHSDLLRAVANCWNPPEPQPISPRADI